MEMNQINIKEMRLEMAAGDQKRDEGLTQPTGVKAVRDIVYGPFEKENQLDVYYPVEAQGKLPVIVNIHGGGFFYGDKELYQYYSMGLAEQGFAVVNFTYRLAPEHLYPAAIEDTNAVFEWLVANQEEYPFDLENIFAVGDSAGAQLTEQYATILSNPVYADLFSFDVPKVQLKAVGLNCGLYFLGSEKNIFEEVPYYFGTTENPAISKQFPVEAFITENYPAVSLTTASDDFLKELANPLYQVFSEKGIKANCKLYENEDGTPLYHVFHIDQKSKTGKQCNEEQLTFFKQFITPNPA